MPLLGANGGGVDPNLRRLLSAQEIGSKSFIGSWFDFFYGPFPRKLWFRLVDMGLMNRVEWDEIAQDLRPDLVEERSDEEEEGDDDDDDVVGPLPPTHERQQQQPGGRVARASSDILLQELVRSDNHDIENAGDGGEQWITDSPSSTAMNGH